MTLRNNYMRDPPDLDLAILCYGYVILVSSVLLRDLNDGQLGSIKILRFKYCLVLFKARVRDSQIINDNYDWISYVKKSDSQEK